MDALSRHDAQGSAHAQRGFQGGRRPLYAFEDHLHILNLEEPALFNETLERFLVLAEAGLWPLHDPASRRA